MKTVVIAATVMTLAFYAFITTYTISQLRNVLTDRAVFAMGYQGDIPGGGVGLWSRIRVTPDGLVRCAKEN